MQKKIAEDLKTSLFWDYELETISRAVVFTKRMEIMNSK